MAIWNSLSLSAGPSSGNILENRLVSVFKLGLLQRWQLFSHWKDLFVFFLCNRLPSSSPPGIRSLKEYLRKSQWPFAAVSPFQVLGPEPKLIYHPFSSPFLLYPSFPRSSLSLFGSLPSPEGRLTRKRVDGILGCSVGSTTDMAGIHSLESIELNAIMPLFFSLFLYFQMRNWSPDKGRTLLKFTQW